MIHPVVVQSTECICRMVYAPWYTPWGIPWGCPWCHGEQFSHCPTHDIIRSMVYNIVNTWPVSQRFPWEAHDIPPVEYIPRPNHGACHCLPHGMCHGAFPWQVQRSPLAHWVFHEGAHGISHVHTVHTIAYSRRDLPWCISWSGYLIMAYNMAHSREFPLVTGVSPNVYHVARPTGQLIPWPKTQLLIKKKKGSAISKGVPTFYRRNIRNSHSLVMISHLRRSSE